MQTMPTKSTYQQTDMEKGTQTATSGFHVCTGDDKEVTGSPKRYVKAADHKILQIKAVMRKYLSLLCSEKIELRISKNYLYD